MKWDLYGVLYVRKYWEWRSGRVYSRAVIFVIALHSLAIEGDESCLVSTLQGNAVRYYHPATSIARTRSSSHCDVMDGCKLS